MVSLALRIAPILANGTTFGAWRSPVSALVWETRGRRFKSSRSDHFFLNIFIVILGRPI